MEALLKLYGHLYEHEKDSNAKLLRMLSSVPEEHRKDERFSRAVDLAAHLCACRENWLQRMKGEDGGLGVWFPEAFPFSDLPARFADTEDAWTTFLSDLSAEGLRADFEFNGSDANRYRWSVEGQIIQLVGHAFYHRGQIVQLIEPLGAETVDTDYLFWAYQRDPRYGVVGP